MALTATAQSALPLTWDETIVPALRKRKFFKNAMLIFRRQLLRFEIGRLGKATLSFFISFDIELLFLGI